MRIATQSAKDDIRKEATSIQLHLQVPKELKAKVGLGQVEISALCHLTHQPNDNQLNRKKILTIAMLSALETIVYERKSAYNYLMRKSA